MSQRDEILATAHMVPSLPAAAIEAARIVQDPDVDFNALARVIEFDPGLTADVLRMANSAYYGGAGTIDSVKHAVVRMGINIVFQMVTASVIGPLARDPVDGYGLRSGSLWQHSVAVALGTTELADTLGIDAPDYAFTAGLLHDIGKIVLGAFVEVDSNRIMEMVAYDKISFDAAEREVLGIDHTEVGAVLLENWNLPREIVQVVRWHHQPDMLNSHRIVGDLVHVSDALCLLEGIGVGNDGLNYRPSVEVMDRLGVETHSAETVLARTLTTFEEVRTLFANADGGEANGS